MSARNLDGSSTSGPITFDSVEAVLSASRTVTGMRVLDRRHRFSYTVRTDTLGPITVLNATIGSDTWIQVSEVRTYYEIVVPITGLIQLSHRGRSIMVTREVAAVQVPEGELTVDRWQAGARLVVVRIGRSTVEDALSEVVGPIASQIDFEPTMSRKCSAVRSWIRMAELLNHELNEPNSPVTSPLVAAPFVDSMVRALLLTANHPYRDALITSNQFATPANVRAVIDIMEAEADSALTVSSLAARAQISVRALQEGFRRSTGMSPGAYLRRVRMRRAHDALLRSDPSQTTVASLARQWGFTNAGRFAAAHTIQFGEPPAATLRRHAYGSNAPRS